MQRTFATTLVVVTQLPWFRRRRPCRHARAGGWREREAKKKSEGEGGIGLSWNQLTNHLAVFSPTVLKKSAETGGDRVGVIRASPVSRSSSSLV